MGEGGREWGSGRREGGRLHSRGDAERQRQGPRSGGARHHDLLLAPYGAHETLELEPERLRLGSLEPHVLHDLLELCGAQTLPAGLQAEEVAAALRQVERAIAGRLEDAQFARALA